MKTVALVMRPELILAEQGQGPRRHWVVQDPVTMKYFRLRDEECSILRMLDGRATLEQIRDQFEKQFAPLRLGVQQLHAFLFHLHELGLVVGEAQGQGRVLVSRDQTARKERWLSLIANPLAIRLPGVGARPIIDALYPYCQWMLSAPAMLCWAAVVLWALTLVVAEFGAFQSRLPDWNTFFSVRTAIWFAIALVLTKTLHELGHALVSRHLGGSCREIGVMLLVGMPTLYCDVSDAWRLSSRSKRVLISSAGMLVELVVAALATLVWWFSEPGVLNAVALRVMFLCSISTLLFNANPLARCDGYYILSDVIDVPNLWQESRRLWSRAAWSWLTGRPAPPDPPLPSSLRWPLMCYALLSVAYCTLLIVGILWLAFQLLEPAGLAVVAWLLLLTVAVGMVVPPLRQGMKLLASPARRPKIRPGRALITILVVAGIAAAVLLTPLPHRISAPAWLEPAGASPVYVSVAGRLQSAVPDQAQVAAGDIVATLENPEMELQIDGLKAEVARQQAALKTLRLLLADDPSVGPQIPAAEKSLESSRQQLAQLQRDQDLLALKAPIAGTILPPPDSAPPPEDGLRLAGWSGVPLAPSNRGCYLEPGQLVCYIGDPNRLEGMIVIDQAVVSFVAPGQAVRIRIDQAPVSVVNGTITDLAKVKADDLPPALAQALGLPIQAPGTAAATTAQTFYQARVKLDAPAAPLLTGMHGEAKILAGWQPLGVRLARYLQRTFRLRA